MPFINTRLVMEPLDGRDGLGLVVDDGAPSNGHEPAPQPASLEHPDGAIRTERTVVSSPRVLPVPMNQHTGWEASNVATAKCDLCQKQSRGVIQKCSQCKLSVCLTCAHDDRLGDDPRHALDPDAVDWRKTRPTSSAVRKTRPPQKNRVRKRKAVITAPGRRQLQERDRVPSKARLRPPPSRKTSVALSVVAGHETHSDSPVTAVRSDEAGGRQDMLDTSAAEREEIAAILAGMHGQQFPAKDGLHLPPVRSVTDTLQPHSYHLPPLRTLQPALGLGTILEGDGLVLPPPAVMAYGNLHRTSDVRHEAATHDGYGNQTDESAPWNQQQQQLESSSGTFPHHPLVAGGHGLANMTFSVSSATPGPVWQSHTVSRTHVPPWRHQHHERVEPISGYEPTVNHAGSASFAHGVRNRVSPPVTSAVQQQQQQQQGYLQRGHQAAEPSQTGYFTTAPTFSVVA
ncbi:hypothetical protein CP532_4880 [Ophiocordyceps camponoti-leonardi (nom. inval.)]|nr:hypothetical protein CP532_4880 [Ophiocordyceps camponoti-leonardi (nom. inval.)]